MTKLLLWLIVILIFRIDWRKLFFVGAVVLTIFSVVIQISSLPYPLDEWMFQPPTSVSSYKQINDGVNLGKTDPLPVNNHRETTQDALVVDSLHSSLELNQSTINSAREERVSRRKRRRWNEKNVRRWSRFQLGNV